MLISRDTILEVKRAVDVVEVVSGYFPLKRAGSAYKALCPFHEEKTPSFHVNPERQIYKCFGCGKAGDAISFVMEFEKADYPEAIRILAERAGITVRYEEGGAQQGPGREILYRINSWAAGVFRDHLVNAPEAEPARAFLKRRGVKEETSELFGLGFSLKSWDDLLNRGRRAGFDAASLAAAGLAVPRESGTGHYDRFRGRLMFPIADPRGKTVAFGARTLGDEQPKFINSPETAIFSKGRGFYGLHLAREEYDRTRTAYIVEGYQDVIGPYQNGVRGIIATLGTALTRDHLKILRRFVDKVVLVFDSDAAGQKASERGLDLLLSENMDLFVAELPAGMDPDDVVMREGPDRLRGCLEKPQEIFNFLMTSLTARHGGETPAARARVVGEMLTRLAEVPDDVKRELLLQELGGRFGIGMEILRGKLARKSEPEPPPVKRPRPVPASETAARELLACVAADPGVAAMARQEAPLGLYPSEETRRIAEMAYDLFELEGEVRGSDLVALLQDPTLRGVAAEILALEIDPSGASARAEACLEKLSRDVAKLESRSRLERLKDTPADSAESDAILREAMEAKKRRPKDHGLLPGRRTDGRDPSKSTGA